ncbi:hypothetical protein [Hymenobacter metallicola]|uniref:Uncharacterized protein n=1 Tax=Hymenobacter metallicola TaxID=2563114 RepID=A0A4Z0Q0I6_9BACT|nr:hypothetical protein [Hymenobacter metallicola]TGE23538.1 hypothetical protein E5K02_20345 [Hymenobacter metallicola]
MNPPRFQPGQCIVCVGTFPDGNPAIPRPQRGQLYHVTGLRYSTRFRQWGVRLAEFAPEYSYGEESFAPMEELSEGEFRKLLAETWVVVEQ